MRILAIIPAAEGMQALPNRNLRIINGKPMLWYVLQNAIRSKYINDILVTSNSDEILLLAHQVDKSILCYHRPENLCGIDVPLEQVINNVRTVVDFDQYDYIVTMQSISPTLTVATLDKAIIECAEKGLDTLISVAEKKNYFWRKTGNGYESLQKYRVRKSQLPPLYMETGAFFISRPQCINEKCRIGDKSDLYVLERDEAIDVFSFGDLQEAEYILTKKKIAFYVNGNNVIGMGHIHRALLLADELFACPTIFYDGNQTDRSYFPPTLHSICAVNGTVGLIEKLHEGNYDLLINDILSTTADYMRRIRSELPDLKIVNFEDDGEGADYADLVINALYSEGKNKKWKVGADYYIAPKLYLLQKPIEIKNRVRNVLITFGGADPQNYTARLLDIIAEKKFQEIRFHVVIGSAYKYPLDLKKFEGSNIEIYKNVNGLLPIMNRCDIAVCARGRTGFELAMCGIPSICIAENERETRHNFLSEENGYQYLGFKPDREEIENALEELVLSSPDVRMNIQKKMRRNDLKNGRARIIDMINHL